MPTAVQRTAGSSGSSLSSHTTASVTPVAGRGYTMWVWNASAGTAQSPLSVSGMGFGAWTKITEISSPNGSQNLSLWAAVNPVGGPGAAGALTIAFSALTEFVQWKLVEHDNVDTTSPSSMIRAVNITTLATALATPSFNLPTSIQSGNSVISAAAYAANPSAQTLSPGSGFDLVSGSAATGNTGAPSSQGAVEFLQTPPNNTVSWTASNTSSKAIIAVELAVPPPVSSAQVSVTQLLSNGNTGGTAVYTTATAAGVNGRGYLAWVISTHASAAVAPSSITGMGMTWVLIEEGTIGNGQLNLSVWRASVNSGASTSALTITFPSAMATAAWKVDELTGQQAGGTNGSAFIRASNIFELINAVADPTGTMPQSPQINNALITGIGYGAGTAQSVQPPAGGRWTALGSTVQLAATNPGQLATAWDQDAFGDNSVDWDTTSSAGKVTIALELIAAAGNPTANAGGDQTVSAFDVVQLAVVASGGTPGYTYAWTPPGGISLTGGTTATPSFTAPPSLTTQTYTFTVVVTDAAGHTGTDTVDVTVRAHNIWCRRSGVLVAERPWTRRSGSLIG